jgi:hypothetical protein
MRNLSGFIESPDAAIRNLQNAGLSEQATKLIKRTV